MVESELEGWVSAIATTFGLPDPVIHTEHKDSEEPKPKPGSLEEWQQDSSPD